MKRWAFAAVLTLAGCATPAAETPVEPPPAAAPPPVVEPPKPADTCGADAVRHLVGRPRTEIPVPLKPELQRVACTTCPVTLDFNPNRLNFFFDAQTGIIKEIRCG
ncbi:peptidase inhibitor I78 [Phenylobacterium sp.]|uniref:peptidase inhibitor I78 n=1 Tax=Phenylobacterium sp. TaxID=1871053 RepID=UPI002810E913|nr:peptidase inhibitor I78 [Phenylobacterium sp.]